jgi:hypothetical protein
MEGEPAMTVPTVPTVTCVGEYKMNQRFSLFLPRSLSDSARKCQLGHLALRPPRLDDRVDARPDEPAELGTRSADGTITWRVCELVAATVARFRVLIDGRVRTVPKSAVRRWARRATEVSTQ